MAGRTDESLRLVDFTVGGRPFGVLDLEDGEFFSKLKGTVQVRPGQRTVSYGRLPGRYGGLRATGAREENAELAWTCAVMGASEDEALAKAGDLLSRLADMSVGRMVEFRARGATYPTFLDIRGPGVATPVYDAELLVQQDAVLVELAVPVAPLGQQHRCDVGDDFAVDSRSDYSFDAGASTDVDVSAGVAVPIAGSGPGGISLALVERWYKPDTLGAGGSAVSSWADSAGSGDPLAQSTGANQPTVLANALDGFSGVQFDGVNDVLQAAGLVNNDPTRTVFVVAKVTSGITVWSMSTVSAAAELVAFSGTWQYNTNQAGGLVSLGGTPTSFAALTIRYNSTSSADGYRNGGAAVNFDPSDAYQAGGSAAFTVGASGGGGNNIAGVVVELIVCNSALSDADKDKVLGYLADRYPTLGSFGTPPSGGAGGIALTAERRARHTARGYRTLESQGTRRFKAGATLSGFKGGVTLRASADTYVEVYVDDNGTNSRLRTDVIIAGVRTNRASVNLASRISAVGDWFWVRGRIEGNVVYAEHFTSAPTPMGTPTTVAPAGGAGYTLSGGEITSLVAGHNGWSLIPQHAAAAMDDYTDEPFTRRNLTLPAKVAFTDEIPGDAPALVDLHLTPSGGAAAPIWALLAWVARPGTPLAGSVVPFGIIEAESGTSLSTWAVTADADYRGGSGLQATASGAGTAAAEFVIDPATLAPDPFTLSELDIEVWARVEIASTLVLPKLVLSAKPDAGTNFGTERFSSPFGSPGKLLTKPSSGTHFRPVRLGTLTVVSDPSRPVKWRIRLAGSWAASSSGVFGVDQLLTVCAGQRAASPTGRANDASYPKFVPSTSETTKLVRSDMSGALAQPGGHPFPDHGLGGEPLEFPPSLVDVLVWLSSVVPDDPVASTASEQEDYAGSAHFSVVPRVHLLRGA